MGSGFDVKEANAQALAYVRKESLDIFNRLHSVQEDVRFVGQVHDAYPELPILPNLRCGAWYVDPAIATPEPAYYKSTDGHFGNWNFNLRRPNLHLLPYIIAKHGLVLVDSTRAGKRIPDALSKTVPIWCAVLNRAMLIAHSKTKEWDVELYCPPGAVSEQERSQIVPLLDGWAQTLVTSAYALPDIPLPLRPLWITPATSVFPRLPALGNAEYLPIICVSASKQVHEGIERRLNGFSYVQGSGDDHELWGTGLTPELFWKHKDALLSTSREELREVVQEIVERPKTRKHREAWKTSPTPVRVTNGRLYVGNASDMPSDVPNTLADVDGPVSFIVVSATAHVPQTDTPEAERVDRNQTLPDQHVLRFKLTEGKKDQLAFLQNVLPASTRFIEKRLQRGDTVCVCCDSGKDASVGIALAALQLFFDDQGQLLEHGAAASAASKESIRTRLQWIISSRPEANPSRVTLKRVNEFLLSSPSYRRR
ncbi:initiator tRNA phosphoribosyl transferase [Dichomitus squalens]|uniref:Initiator tRNA phosphoribosyl transferase n=1 Tax=Dichomitus squalens TaxID=114155 RepID=A0A4Q9PUZ5_9APHY|nr:initiator tRNA phosphoribosyl transferase [Dichomitus squalens]